MCPTIPSSSCAFSILCRVRVIGRCLEKRSQQSHGSICAGRPSMVVHTVADEIQEVVTLHSFACISDAAGHAAVCISHGKALCRCDGRRGSPLLSMPLGFGAGAAPVLHRGCCSLLLHRRLGQRFGRVCGLLSRRGSLRQCCLFGHAGRKACMHRHLLEHSRRRCAP